MKLGATGFCEASVARLWPSPEWSPASACTLQGQRAPQLPRRMSQLPRLLTWTLKHSSSISSSSSLVHTEQAHSLWMSQSQPPPHPTQLLLELQTPMTLLRLPQHPSLLVPPKETRAVLLPVSTTGLPDCPGVEGVSGHGAPLAFTLPGAETQEDTARRATRL